MQLGLYELVDSLCKTTHSLLREGGREGVRVMAVM